MPILVPFVALFASGCVLSGALFAWIVTERRNIAQREATARKRAPQVHARHVAYLDLERRSQEALTSFEGREAELTRTLAAQKEKLDQLHAALDSHQGLTHEVPPREAVRWMEQVFEPRRAAAAERDAMAAELGVQSTLIEELTDRIRGLEPLRNAPSADQEAERSAEIARLQSDLDHAREVAGRVSLAEAGRAAAIGEQEALRAQMSVMQFEHDQTVELCRERDEAVAALEARTAEIVRLRNGSSRPDAEAQSSASARVEQELERLRSEAALAVDAQSDREAQFVERETRFAERETQSERALEQARSELGELRDTVGRREARIRALAEEQESLVCGRDSLVEDLELERTSELESRRQIDEQHASELEQRDVQLRESRSEAQGLQAALDQLESGDQANERELATVRSQLDRAERELENLNQKLEKGKQREEHARTSLGERSARDAEQLQILRGEHRETLAERESLAVSLAAREKEVTELESAVANLERQHGERQKEESKDVAALEKKLAKSDGKVERAKATHESRAARSAEQLKTLRTESRAAGTEAKRATAALADGETELAALKKELEAAGRNEAKLEKESRGSLTRMERELTRSEGKLAKLEGKLVKLEARLAKQLETGKSRSEELSARKNDVRDLKQQVKRLEGSAQELSLDLEAKHEATSGQSAQIGDLMQALDRARNEAASTSGKLARKGSQVEAAQDMLASLLPMLEALGGQLDETN